AAVAALAFGMRPPIDLAAALGVLALITAAMYAVGMIIAALAPTPNSAVAIGLIGFLGLGATGGMFGSRDALPGPVAEVGAHLPFGAGMGALAAAGAGESTGARARPSRRAALVGGSVVGAVLCRWG